MMGLNYRSGFCGACVGFFKWVPVLFILSIIGWSYYAYVLHFCFNTLESLGVRIGALIGYHLFLFLFLWSYSKTVLTPPGRVPSRYSLTSAEVESVESSENPGRTLERLAVKKDLAVSMRSINGEIRYCGDCGGVKPDRTHHCSVCGHCVLKMDHHCPWVNNCVAFYNYKFFLLFLLYALLYCFYVAASSLKYFLLFWSNVAPSHGKFHVLFLFFVSAMFSVSLLSLFGYHCYLVSRNLTTLEAFRAPVFRGGNSDKKGFHLGTFNNIQEVFGDNKLLWFFPIFTSLGDGLYFPQRNNQDVEEGRNNRRNDLENQEDEESVPMISAEDRWAEIEEESEEEWTKINDPLSTSTSSSNSLPKNAVIEPSHSVSINL